MPEAPGDVRAAAERLKPYVPRLVIDWLRTTPDLRHLQVDGSLAFVDISGFTELTERLARRGKVGAEEVSDTLDTIFTALLDVAYDYGAGLLKWGGDALLLLYDGDGHAARCCRGAAEMQEELGRIGRIRTTGGPVTLRMSVGVNSGTFDFFLVGESHRELIVTGPAASATVDMESVANAEEIAVSAATAELIGEGHTGERRGDAVLLRAAPDEPRDPAPEVGDVSGLDVPSCVPVELRKQLLVEQGEAEHRTVSVAFVQFSGTDALLERSGPDALADALHALVSNVQDACGRVGATFFATDINRDGGKIIVVTGAPWSGGDDEERILRVARAIVDRAGTIPIRVGVNSGRAFTCDFGPPYRRTYQIYGDAVNLAARVMGRGEPGDVIATEETLSRARTGYDVVELDPFLVKGKSEPVRASIVGATAGARDIERVRAPLVGREAEMAVLLAAADAARQNTGRVVELVGEPGIGKSRLVEELGSRSGLPSFWAVCEQYESSSPYFPFRGLLHDLLHVARDAPPEHVERALRDRVATVATGLEPWLPLLGGALGLELSPTPETSRLEERFIPDRTAQAMEELLAALLADATVLVFDDVHWMDEASGHVLIRITERAAERPWLVIVTRRDVSTGFAAAPGPSVVTLRPAPLDESDAAELARATAEDAPLPSHVLEALAERSGGNPLFLNELVAASLAGAGLDDLPDSVEALMAAHIDRLAPRERTVLRYAAVLGATFEADLLVDALHEEIPALDDEVWTRLADFLGEDEPGVLRFRHELMRDAAYEGLPYRRRRALHERVGEAIERRAGERVDDEAEHLSLHFFHAHDFDKAWRHSRIAGDHAFGIYANVEAATFYERALQAARRRRVSLEERGAVLEGLGDVRFRLGEFEAGGLAFRRARRLLSSDAAAAGRLRLKEAIVPYRLGRYPQALAALSRGLRELEGAKGREAEAQRARLLVYQGVVRHRQGRATEALEWLGRAVTSAKRSGARDALAQAYQNLDLAYFQLGQPANAVFGERALPIFEELGNLTQQAGVLNNLGMRAYWLGRWDEAVELYERARTIWASTGDAWSASFAMYNSGEILSDQGRLAAAEAPLQGALRAWRASRARPETATALTQLGRLRARQGRFDDALELLGEAQALQAELGQVMEALFIETCIAECHVLAGRPEASLEVATDALVRARSLRASQLIALLCRVLGWALLSLDRFDEARDALEESIDTARVSGLEYELALTLGALVTLGDRSDDGLVADFTREHLAITERLGVVWTAAPGGVGEDGTA